jgi:hypothetical protein
MPPLLVAAMMWINIGAIQTCDQPLCSLPERNRFDRECTMLPHAVALALGRARAFSAAVHPASPISTPFAFNC